MKIEINGFYDVMNTFEEISMTHTSIMLDDALPFGAVSPPN